MTEDPHIGKLADFTVYVDEEYEHLSPYISAFGRPEPDVLMIYLVEPLPPDMDVPTEFRDMRVEAKVIGALELEGE